MKSAVAHAFCTVAHANNDFFSSNSVCLCSDFLIWVLDFLQVATNYELKTKTVGALYTIPQAKRQCVTRICENGANLFVMGFEEADPKNVHNFILESSSIKMPNGSASIEDGAWKNLLARSRNNGRGPNKQPVYAIDIRDTFFEETEPWNFNNFDCHHSIIHDSSLKDEDLMPGIQNSYVNIGMLFTWFCIHREDSDLASVNYLHCGAPKYWFCVPKSEGPKLEAALLDMLGKKFSFECKTVYRHKCFIVDESFLRNYGIKYSKIVQHPGEFVFTLYGAYHWGFNGGFNVCESMNLASPRFKQIYEEAVICASSCQYSREPLAVHRELGKLLENYNERANIVVNFTYSINNSYQPIITSNLLLY